MEKKNSLKEDYEEIKLFFGDIEIRNFVFEVGFVIAFFRVVVEERIVLFKLGDLEEVLERERFFSVDLKEEISIDSVMNGEWDFFRGGKQSFIVICIGEEVLCGFDVFCSECYFFGFGQVQCSCLMGILFSLVKSLVIR